MSAGSKLLDELIDALQCLPGVGKKSSQRIAFQLLERDRQRALHLADTISAAMQGIGNCELCRTFSETRHCRICDAHNRDTETVCVVENPLDVAAIEQAADYRGRYFVLMGHLSPIDGITPDKLGMPQLEQRLASGEVKELIVATGTTMEGEATAHYLKEMAQAAGVTATRIAYGVPVGGDLEYIDGTTLSLAISSRREY